MSPDSKAWFAPKRFGYGAGLPIAWQGWAVLLAGLAVIVGTPLVLPDAAGAGLMLAAIAVLVVVAAFKTEGGWRWRWGD